MEKKLNIMRTLMMICGCGIIYIIAYLLVVSGLSMIPACRQLHTMYLNAWGMAAGAGAVCLFLRDDEWIFRIINKPVLQLVAVVTLAYGTSAFFNIILGCVPWEAIFEQQVTPDEAVFFGIPLWARMICYELVAPFSEEILFRRVIYKKLRGIAPFWVAASISALLFGLYHGNLVQGIYAFIMGIFLALVYEWTGSFIAPVLFHMIANHLSDITYEFPKLGEVVYSPYGAIVSVVLITVAMMVLIKNKNKCSKK